MLNGSGYLPDLPLRDFSNEDALRHCGLVAALRQIIDDVPTPFCIGLLGSWGIGKSSIVDAVVNDLENASDTRCIVYDAWKHDSASFRAELIRESYTSANARIPDMIQKGIDYETSTNREGKVTFPKPRVLAALWDALYRIFIALSLTAVVGGMALLVAWKIVGIAPADVPWTIVVPFLVGTLIGIAAGAIGAFPVFAVETHTQSSPRAERPSEFRGMFCQLLRDLKPGRKGRIVFVIDNLDRCSPQTATEILTMLNTFLAKKGCIYIVACDDAAIRRHLDELPGENCDSAQARLSKVFNLTLRIPPPSPADVAPLIRRLAEQIDTPLPSGVCDALVWAVSHTPRDAIQYVNDYKAAMAALERQREEGAVSYADDGKMANAVAKVLVIRKCFPDVYAHLLSYPGALTYLERQARGEEVAASDLPAVAKDNAAELHAFLAETEIVDAEHALRAIWLKDPVVAAEFSRLNGFLEARGDITDLPAEYSGLSPEEQARWRSHASHGLQHLRRTATAGRLRAFARILATIHETVPDAEKTTAANTLAMALRLRDDTLPLEEFVASDMVPALLCCSDAFKCGFIERVLGADYASATTRIEWFRVLLQNAPAIPDQFRDQMWTVLGELRNAGHDAPEIPALAAAMAEWQGSQLSEAAQKFAQSALTRVAGAKDDGSGKAASIAGRLADYKIALAVYRYMTSGSDRNRLMRAIAAAYTDESSGAPDAIADARRQVAAALASLPPADLRHIEEQVAGSLAEALVSGIVPDTVCGSDSALPALDRVLISLNTNETMMASVTENLSGRIATAASHCAEALVSTLGELKPKCIVRKAVATGMLRAAVADKLESGLVRRVAEAVHPADCPALVDELIEKHGENAESVVGIISEGAAAEKIATELVERALRQLRTAMPRNQAPNFFWVSWLRVMVGSLGAASADVAAKAFVWLKEAVGEGAPPIRQRVLERLTAIGPEVRLGLDKHDGETAVQEAGEGLIAALVHSTSVAIEQGSDELPTHVAALAPFADRMSSGDGFILSNAAKRADIAPEQRRRLLEVLNISEKEA